MTGKKLKIHLWKFTFYLRLPDFYLLIAAKAVNLVADVITQVAEVVLVDTEVEHERFGMSQVILDIMF